MPELLRISKQLLIYLSYLSCIPLLLFQPILRQILSRQRLSCVLGPVLLLLVLQAVAEYLFFWTFHLVVSVIEKAFREAFGLIWWALAAAYCFDMLWSVHGRIFLGHRLVEQRESER